MDLCGIPSKANWYVSAVVGREGETTYVDMYPCDAHMPGDLDDVAALGVTRVMSPESEGMDWDARVTAVRSLFRFDRPDEWEVLGVEVTHIR